jgi:predicted XRE-type DNA-binding protein
MTRKNIPKAEKSGGNIFADLGMPHPEQEQLKAHLTLQIYQTIKERGLTQTQAAAILGLKQPHVSLLMRNRSGTFSVGKLMELLTKLDQDVQITVRPKRSRQAEVSFVAR